MSHDGLEGTRGGATLHLERWEALHSVRFARRVLEDGWGLSLILTGSEGPLAHLQGGVLRGSSDVCRAALFTRGGFVACDAHYRETATRTEGARAAPCHLGLSTLSEPIVVDGQVLGHVVVSGFTDSPEEPDRATVAEGLVSLGVDADEASAAVLQLRSLTTHRSPRAVLRLVAEEITRHEDERRSRHVDTPRPGLWGILGRSPQMEVVFELLPRLAASDATVLVLGESGTGKELVAQALHRNGKRAELPFVAQNCAAMPHDLLESTLFGHVRGAFSGADRPSEGLFGAADGGTLFLDEVGDMSPALQVKLLRVLQDGTYTPVGGTALRKANVRVIAATHVDLAAAVRDGRFRQDLYYRLHVLPVQLPPLRDRVGDLRLLTDAFLSEIDGLPGEVEDAAWDCMLRYRWPGNVRELRAEVQRWQLHAAGEPSIRPEHLSPAIQEVGGFGGVAVDRAATAAARGEGTLAEAVEAVERAIIERGLQRTGGNRTQLAKELDISRTTLADRMKRFGLD